MSAHGCTSCPTCGAWCFLCTPCACARKLKFEQLAHDLGEWPTSMLVGGGRSNGLVPIIDVSALWFGFVEGQLDDD